MNENQYKQVDKYIVTKNLLGRGSFGDVYRGFLKSDHSQLTAVKVIPIEKISSDPKFLKLLKREIEIMQQIEQINVVRMYGASKTHSNLYMFLEYCKDGDMKQLLRKSNGRFTETQCVQYLVQIVAGFNTLYENNIIHRDIKPANILLHDQNIKITDFGFARHIPLSRVSHQSNRSVNSQKGKAGVNMEELMVLSNVGTPLYMCPQILNNQKFSSKCDIWSLGMMTYEMLYGRTPWMANSPFQLYQNIRKMKLEFDLRPQRSDGIKALIRKMLVIDDRQRISWPELFNHDLFQTDQLKPINNQMADDLSDQQNANKNDFKSLTDNQSPEKEKPQFYTNQNVENFNEHQLDKIVQQQDKNLYQEKVIDTFIRYFSFERNIVVFHNYSSTLYFNFFNQKKNNKMIQSHLFQKQFFLMQRQQINLYQQLINTLEKHRMSKLFNQNDWYIYYNSLEYDNCLNKLKNDKEFMNPYFEQVQKNTLSLQKRLEQQNPEQFNDLQDISGFLLDDFVKNDQKFNEVYKKTLTEFIQNQKLLLQANDYQQNENRQYLLVLRFVQLTLNNDFNFISQPKKCFDFDKFYEKYDYIKTEELISEINQFVSIQK